MGRVINPETAGKERTRLTRSIVLALRELMGQNQVNSETKDLAAYITLALHEIARTVEDSVRPWEKRGYWVKADRSRMEGNWAEQLSAKMETALQDNDWQTVAMTAAQVSEKLNTIKVPKRHNLGTPWNNAWEKMIAKQ